jgi:3-hydroxybutyryl-CoA dehydrogenase
VAIVRVGIVGFGAMGSGIAQVCAQAGYTVKVREIDQAAIDRGWKGVDGSLARIVKAGRMTEDDAKAARGRMSASTALADLRDSDLVIEAVLEIADVKRQVFEELDRLCAPATILCSNTSSLPIIDMAIRTGRPDRFAGLHFFNPAPVMQLVEVVRALTTSDQTVETLRAFVARLGKTPVVSKDVAGFIVNRLLVPYMLDAIRVLEQGIATPEDIDTAVKLGLRHPMGPFELLDYTGLDICLHVGDVFFEEFREPRMAPPPLLRRMVAAGHLGRKTGKGFYEYDDKGQRR